MLKLKVFAKHTKKFFSTLEPPKLNFDDTKSLYNQKGTFELAKNYILTSSCRIPLISKFGPQIMENDPSGIVKELTKHTYFKQFCGGESLVETIPTLEELNKLNMKCMLDYSIEGASGVKGDKEKEEKMDKITQIVIDSIYFAKEHPTVNFAVVKVTGICDTNLLERISEIFTYVEADPKYNYLIPESLKISDYHPKRTRAFQLNEQPPKPLEDWELGELDRVLKRLMDIGNACKKNNVPLLVDAEQSYYQAAIDHFFMIMCLKFNDKGETPLIYNTYQMYLADSLNRLQFDHQFVKSSNIAFGAKLVRGAYIKTETERFHKLKLPLHPVNNGIELTHKSYKNGVDYCLDNISSMGLVIASHNKQTVIDSTQGLYDRKLERNHPRVMFAQLYGMGDYLSLTLAQNGYNISKYLVFGPIDALMPFFARRLTENSDMLGGSVQETKRISHEIIRRITKQ